MCVWYQEVDLDREKEHGTSGKQFVLLLIWYFDDNNNYWGAVCVVWLNAKSVPYSE